MISFALCYNRMPWFRLIPFSVWIPFSLTFLLLFHIPIANANHSGLTSRHGGCIGTWSGFTPCIFYTLPLTYIHPLLELQQVSQGKVVFPSHNKADNTFKRGFKPVSVTLLMQLLYGDEPLHHLRHRSGHGIPLLHHVIELRHLTGENMQAHLIPR